MKFLIYVLFVACLFLKSLSFIKIMRGYFGCLRGNTLIIRKKNLLESLKKVVIKTVGLCYNEVIKQPNNVKNIRQGCLKKFTFFREIYIVFIIL